MIKTGLSMKLTAMLSGGVNKTLMKNLPDKKWRD